MPLCNNFAISHQRKRSICVISPITSVSKTSRPVSNVLSRPVIRSLRTETDVLDRNMSFRNALHQLAGLAQLSDELSREEGFSIPWESGNENRLACEHVLLQAVCCDRFPVWQIF